MAFERWQEQNLFLEQQISADSTGEIRRILLAKYHLLSPQLCVPAMRLVQHTTDGSKSSIANDVYRWQQ